MSAQEKSLVQLAAQEGHDADIPSNEGVVTGKAAARSSVESPASVFDKDVEKEAGPDSRPPSSASKAEPNAPPSEVWWDGDADPENPMNWSPFRKWGTVALVSGLTFLTPLGSSIFAPSIPTVMAEFGSNSELLSGFVVSVYVLGFAFGPLVIAPLSELYGRLALYHACGVLFLIFNVACALSTSLNMLIVFRFLAGCVGASPLTLGGGTIADLMTTYQRAKAMSVSGPSFATCANRQDLGDGSKYVSRTVLKMTNLEALGPVLGPIMGVRPYNPDGAY
jgi:hypothetical protein